MITKFSSVLTVVLALLAGVFAWSGDVSAQSNGCLSRAEAATAVRSGQVVSLSQLLGQYPNISGSDVVSAELCQSGGRYYYLVSVLHGGTVRTVTVDASAMR